MRLPIGSWQVFMESLLDSLVNPLYICGVFPVEKNQHVHFQSHHSGGRAGMKAFSGHAKSPLCIQLTFLWWIQASIMRLDDLWWLVDHDSACLMY